MSKKQNQNNPVAPVAPATEEKVKRIVRKVTIEITDGNAKLSDGTLTVTASLEQISKKYKGCFLGDCRRVLEERKADLTKEYDFLDVFPEREAGAGSSKVEKALDSQKKKFISNCRASGMAEEAIQELLKNF